VPEKLPKAKDSSVQRRVEKMRRELLEPWTIGADFYRSAQDINLPYDSFPGHSRFMSKR
jgi:hypothetical protein